MRDRLLVFAAPGCGLQLALCAATALGQEAAARHGLASGSAAALGQALAGALLLAAAGDEERVSLQLECAGPLRGLLVEADADGGARGLVRVGGLALPETGAADLRPLLGAGPGALTVTSRRAGGLHRTGLQLEACELDEALGRFLRATRGDGEVGLIASGAGESDLLGALLVGDGRRASPGHPFAEPGDLRPSRAALRESLTRARAAPDAVAAAHQLGQALSLGPLLVLSDVEPRFRCSCSRERVLAALSVVGPDELRDMAARDGGAVTRCDFCSVEHRFSAAELSALAGP